MFNQFVVIFFDSLRMMIVVAIALLFIASLLIVNLKIVKTWLSYSLLIKFKDKLKSVSKSLVNYFKYFGWFYVFLVLLFIISQWFFVEVFPYILIVTVLAFFMYKPLKLVYMLIGSKSSLSAFMFLFIATQLLFTWAYSVYLFPNYSFNELLFNTFCTSLTQQPSNIFDKFLSDNKSWDIYGNVFILLNTQIFISWIYLGVLIAGLYQKLRNE